MKPRRNGNHRPDKHVQTKPTLSGNGNRVLSMTTHRTAARGNPSLNESVVRPSWRRLIRRLWGALLQACAVIAYIACLRSGRLDLALFFSVPLGYIYHHGRRLKKKSFPEQLAGDGRRHVLILRSYTIDALVVPRPWFVAQCLLLSVLDPWFLFHMIPRVTFAEALDNLLKAIGLPVVLTPSEDPSHGPTEYQTDESIWREEVQRLAATASLIVVIAGHTASLQWECTQVLTKPIRRKVLLLLPPDGEGKARNRTRSWYEKWEELRRQHELPAVDDRTAALWFDKGGKCHPIEARSARLVDQLDAVQAWLAKTPTLARERRALRFAARVWRRIIDWSLILPISGVIAACLVAALTPAHTLGHRADAIREFVKQQQIVAFLALLYVFSMLLEPALSGILRRYRPNQPDRLRTHSTVRHFLRIPVLIGGLTLAALVARSFFVEAFKIHGGSMIPTLMTGEHIFVNKLTYGPLIPFTDDRLFSSMPPLRGDVMVFKFPENKQQDFIERVVGVPSDTLEVINGRPIINGWLVPHCYVGTWGRDNARLYVEFLANASYFTLFAPDPTHPYGPDEPTCQSQDDCGLDQTCRAGICGHYQGPSYVQRNEVWVMGDNRHNSHDSRTWRNGQGGGVPLENIKGRAGLVWMSFAPGGGIVPERLFIDVMGPPQLPEHVAPSLRETFEKCLRSRPTLAQTTPPRK